MLVLMSLYIWRVERSRVCRYRCCDVSFASAVHPEKEGARYKREASGCSLITVPLFAGMQHLRHDQSAERSQSHVDFRFRTNDILHPYFRCR